MHWNNNYVRAFSLSSLITTSLSQTSTDSSAVPISTASGVPTHYNWTYDIPPAEASALAGIVEDIPPRVNLTAKRSDDTLIEKRSSIVKRKDNLSPTYPLIYRVPLPIPPVKQPLK